MCGPFLWLRLLRRFNVHALLFAACAAIGPPITPSPKNASFAIVFFLNHFSCAIACGEPIIPRTLVQIASGFIYPVSVRTWQSGRRG